MAQITLKGNPVQTIGNLPAVGEAAPGFTLVDKDLKEVSLPDYAGQKVVLNIFPSIDTPTCAMSVRRFNAEIGKHGNAVAICASMDLPFAHGRFCGAEGLEKVVSASAFRNAEFGNALWRQHHGRAAQGPFCPGGGGRGRKRPGGLPPTRSGNRRRTRLRCRAAGAGG